MKRNNRGFTMIELLAVLAILAIVITLVSGNFAEKGEQAKAKAAKIEMEQMGQALDLFKLEVGRYPSSSEGLQALITAPSGATNWSGPYLKKNSLPKDPWQNEYRYTSPGANNRPYDILSLGADGKEGGEGANKDIVTGQ
jgi:general secretion pathway protein G